MSSVASESGHDSSDADFKQGGIVSHRMRYGGQFGGKLRRSAHFDKLFGMEVEKITIHCKKVELEHAKGRPK